MFWSGGKFVWWKWDGISIEDMIDEMFEFVRNNWRLVFVVEEFEFVEEGLVEGEDFDYDEVYWRVVREDGSLEFDFLFFKFK